MRTDDQYFEPGDKVMRVGFELPSNAAAYNGPNQPDIPQYGKVYCVEDFWEGPVHNAIMLVGFGGWRFWRGMKAGWRAAHFRRVSEIKLCVRAAEKMSLPVEFAPELAPLHEIQN